MQKPRQFIFIMTDTQRTDMLGCYGNKAMNTPNLDRLAAEGIRFDKAYTCQPVCGPARSALFTGTFPHTNGSWGNSMPLGDNVKTVGQRLRDQNIQTAYIGKWHLDGGDYFGLGKCPDGWDPDFWYDMRNYLEEHTPEDRRRSRQVDLNRDPELTKEFTFGHRCSSRAIEFIEKHRDQDYLLVVSYDEPHGPFICPKPYSEMYLGYTFPKSRNVFDTLKGKPEHQRVWAGNRLTVDKNGLDIRAADFFGCNSFVDHEIGRVIDAADSVSPDALIMYTSDHGDFLESHSLAGKGPAMYDEITHVPFIVRWRGEAPAGAVSPTPVSHIDVAPTMLDFFGLDCPAILEGASMRTQIHQPAEHIQRTVFMEFTRYEIDHDGFGGFQPIRAAYDGRFKLVINLMTSDELYDMDDDPEELENLINSPDHIALRNQLHDKILNWMNQTRDPFRGYYWEQRPWRSDARDATWKYTGMTRQRENEGYEPKQLDYDTGLEITDSVRKK